jgi:hypothetical protein
MLSRKVRPDTAPLRVAPTYAGRAMKHIIPRFLVTAKEKVDSKTKAVC